MENEKTKWSELTVRGRMKEISKYVFLNPYGYTMLLYCHTTCMLTGVIGVIPNAETIHKVIAYTLYGIMVVWFSAYLWICGSEIKKQLKAEKLPQEGDVVI